MRTWSFNTLGVVSCIRLTLHRLFHTFISYVNLFISRVVSHVYVMNINIHQYASHTCLTGTVSHIHLYVNLIEKSKKIEGHSLVSKLVIATDHVRIESPQWCYLTSGTGSHAH